MEDELAKKDTKYLLKAGLILLGVIILIVIIVLIVISSNKTKKCKTLYDNVKKQVTQYVKNKELEPKVNGDFVTVNLEDLDNKIYLNDNVCTGSVKYTKHNDEYILTYEIKDCNYCSTNDKKWTQYTNNYNSKKSNIDVVALYNYVTIAEYNTKWTKWLSSEEIGEKKEYDVNLPLDEKVLPEVPEGGEIYKIVKEDETRYSYRDKKWKWYANASADYSKFSSTQPSGYANKDSQTEIKTNPTDWSLDYPEEASYRTINKTTGYRYYKQEGKTKTYWNNGAYYPTAPDSSYTKDSSSSVSMYSYTDKMWRWYNGTRRNYSAFSSVPYSSYTHLDSEIYTFTSWSSYENVSKLNATNKSYREERTDVYSRYLIKYKMKSMEIYNNYLTKEEFEEQTNHTLSEIANDDKYELMVKFKYRYN